MADTKLGIFNNDGQTAYVDVRTESTNGEGRQVIVIGDPTSNNAVAAIQATDPASNTEGIVVRDVNTSAIVSRLGQTINVSLDPGHTLGSISGIGTTVTVQFDPGHELGSIRGNSNTLTVFLPDTGHELGSIRGIANTIAIDPVTGSGSQTMDDNFKAQRVLIVGSQSNASLAISAAGTLQVFLPDTGHELGSIRGNTNTLTVFLPDTGHELGSIRGIANTIGVTEITPSGATISDSNFRAERVLIAGSHAAASLAVFPSATAGTFQVYIPDTGHEIGTIRGNTNTLTVFLPDTGHELGTIRGNTNTLTVYLPDTGHELGSIRQINSTVAVVPVTGSSVKLFDDSFDAERVLIVGSSASSSIAVNGMVNIAATASIFTVSGSASGVSVSGNTLVSPSANYNFKVFALALSTTAQVHLSPKFTNGAGTSPTEFWRYA